MEEKFDTNILIVFLRPFLSVLFKGGISGRTRHLGPLAEVEALAEGQKYFLLSD